MARLREFLARLHRIIGGSSETELKLFAVTPVRDPSGAAAVTTVTPVAKAPSALRNSRASNSRCSSIGPLSLAGARRALSFGRRPRAHRSGMLAAETLPWRVRDECDRDGSRERNRTRHGISARPGCGKPRRQAG